MMTISPRRDNDDNNDVEDDDNLLQEWGCGACHWKTRGWDQPWQNPGKVDFPILLLIIGHFSPDQKKMIE